MKSLRYAFEKTLFACGSPYRKTPEINQVYMITMGVVLLNLLIAVLSTAHDQVYANAEKEFHLARARLIYQSARVAKRNRPPPPLNLIRVFFCVLLDTVNEAVHWYR